jgi:ubiquinone/menaquinone biosynthesis C-methylase UbiE
VFVQIASQNMFKDQKGSPVSVSFRAQSVLDVFCDANGHPLEDQSMDLVNSCGAIAHHFDPEATTKVMKEVARVLKKGGLATIDSGRAGTSAQLLEQIAAGFGLRKLSSAKSCFVDTATQICFIRD